MTESSNSESKPETKSVAKTETNIGNAQSDAKKAGASAKNRNKTVSHEQPARKAQRKVSKPGKTETSKVSSRRVSPFLWMLVLTNSILIVILGLSGGYFWYTSSQKDSQQLSQIQQKMESARQSIADENKALFAAVKQQTEAENSKLVSRLVTEQSQLSEQMIRLNTTVEEMGGNRIDVQAEAEIHYLIRMAERKVVIEQNVTQARYLLTEAQTLLNDSAEPASIRLRELIAQDLNQLSVKEFSNNDEILIQLNALLIAASTLPFAEPEQVFGETQKELSDDLSDWRENLAISWQNLKDDFLDWDVMDEPIRPYMNLQQQEIARGMLQYHILAARHAVLARNAEMYLATLHQVNILLPVFDPDSDELTVVKQQLESLIGLTVKQEILFSLSSYGYLRGKDKPVETNPELTPVVESQL